MAEEGKKQEEHKEDEKTVDVVIAEYEKKITELTKSYDDKIKAITEENKKTIQALISGHGDSIKPPEKDNKSEDDYPEDDDDSLEAMAIRTRKSLVDRYHIKEK